MLSAKDYCLILGMPGTGKTRTLEFIIRELLARDYSVLLTSYTHSAVDNVLLKLLEYKTPFLRIGDGRSVHQSIRPYLLKAEVKKAAQLQQEMISAKLVASSCLAVNHVLFTKRRFDFCIVDEAGQITQPTILGPLRSASTFVLVGDHFQVLQYRECLI